MAGRGAKRLPSASSLFLIHSVKVTRARRISLNPDLLAYIVLLSWQATTYCVCGKESGENPELTRSGIGERTWHDDTGASREVATQGRIERFMPLSPKTCQGNKHCTFAIQGEQLIMSRVFARAWPPVFANVAVPIATT